MGGGVWVLGFRSQHLAGGIDSWEVLQPFAAASVFRPRPHFLGLGAWGAWDMMIAGSGGVGALQEVQELPRCKNALCQFVACVMCHSLPSLKAQVSLGRATSATEDNAKSVPKPTHVEVDSACGRAPMATGLLGRLSEAPDLEQKGHRVVFCGLILRELPGPSGVYMLCPKCVVPTPENVRAFWEPGMGAG